jgi:hypothetical protein
MRKLILATASVIALGLGSTGTANPQEFSGDTMPSSAPTYYPDFSSYTSYTDYPRYIPGITYAPGTTYIPGTAYQGSSYPDSNALPYAGR